MPNTPIPRSTLTQRLADLETRIAELARAVGRSIGVVRDPAGNVVLTTATEAGNGLGRPFIPITFTTFDSTQWTGTTAAATILATSTIYRQHSHVIVTVWSMGTVAGTTGTLQLQIAGTAIGTPVTVTDAVTLTTLGPFPVPGAHMAQVSINVLAGRTGGTGIFRLAVGNAYSMAP